MHERGVADAKSGAPEPPANGQRNDATVAVCSDSIAEDAARDWSEAEWYERVAGHRIGWAHNGPTPGLMMMLELPSTHCYFIFRGNSCRSVNAVLETLLELEPGEEVAGYYQYAVIDGRPRYVWHDWAVPLSRIDTTKPIA